MGDPQPSFTDTETVMRLVAIEEEPLVQDLRKLEQLLVDQPGGLHPVIQEHLKVMWERYS